MKTKVDKPNMPSASHFALIQLAFDTAGKPDRESPAPYGVGGDCVPDGCFERLAFRFVWRG